MNKNIEYLVNQNEIGSWEIKNYRRESSIMTGEVYDLYFYNNNPVFFIDFQNEEIVISNPYNKHNIMITNYINELIYVYEGYFNLNYNLNDPWEYFKNYNK